METNTDFAENDQPIDQIAEIIPVNETGELRDKILNHIASMEHIHFKSQQRGEPELNFSEKRTIAEEILNRSYSMFLSRFGYYLLMEHLQFFENPSSDESYEVRYHVDKLKSTKCKPLTDIQVKNRRFEALKRLMSEGEYFSVNEMRKRNPLLFDQLLGNFLADPKIKLADMTEHPVAHILLEQIEQDQVDSLRKFQIEMEKKQAEEYVTSSDEDSASINACNIPVNTKRKSAVSNNLVLWGKSYKGNHTIGKSRWKNKHWGAMKMKTNKDKKCNISHEEKLLLISEFTSSMFNNFLQGKDEFDYSEVDNNPEYDDINQCDVDEEEKYFDSESPEEVTSQKEIEDDDEFDRFMKQIDNEVACDNLTESMKNMNANKMC